MSNTVVEFDEYVPHKHALIITNPDGSIKNGTEEWFVRIRPPTVLDDAERRDYMSRTLGPQGVKPDYNSVGLLIREIWLTYAGAFIKLSMPKRDEKGNCVPDKSDPGSFEREVIEISWPERPNYNEFRDAISKLPTQVLYSWSLLVRQNVPEWQNGFF